MNKGKRMGWVTRNGPDGYDIVVPGMFLLLGSLLGASIVLWIIVITNLWNTELRAFAAWWNTNMHELQPLLGFGWIIVCFGLAYLRLRWKLMRERPE